MKFLSVAMTLAFVSGCALAKNPKVKEMTIAPGEVRWVQFDIPKEDVQLYCHGTELKLERKGKKAQGIVIANYFSDLTPFTCELKDKDIVLETIHFKVEAREYKSEKLRVEPKHIKLSAKDQKRADEEQIVLNKIWASSPSRLMFETSFKQPMDSFVTSIYGTKRVYNKTKQGQHLGTDYRAAIGDKVPAANAGKVVFAGDLFYTGWTVIIDHGLDIFTVYGHCSKTLVEAGKMVQKGELVALSGNTGRTSGPHLHWGVKVQNNYIDGYSLIDETKKYFKD